MTHVSQLTMEALVAYSESSDSEPEVGEENVPTTLYSSSSAAALKIPLPRESTTSDIWSSKVGPHVAETQSLDVGGYVPKRKRCRGMEGGTLSAAVPTEMHTVSQYLSSPAVLDSNSKRTKQQSQIPKRCFTTLRGHSRPSLSLKWHPCDWRLLLSASLDRKLKLWDASKQNTCIATYGFHKEAVRDVEWVSTNAVISGGFDNTARYSDIEKGRTTLTLSHEGFVTAVKVHPEDRNVILTGDSRTHLQTWDLRSGKKEAQYIGAGGKILDIVFLQNKKQFAASSDIVRKNASNQALSVWDVSSTVVLSNQVYLEPFTCPCLKAHPVDSTFMAQSNGNYVVVFASNKPYKHNKHKRFEGHTVEGHNVCFDISVDGSLLCSASATGGAFFYDYYSAKLMHSLTLSHSPCLSVAWHQQLPSTIAVSDWDTQIHILQ